MNDPFKSGYVALVGCPNVGKSTLLNALLGQKVAIVSAKPQTTRQRLGGILTTDSYQIIFEDTPGILEPRDRFNEILVEEARDVIRETDLIYHLIDASDRDPVPHEQIEFLALSRKPKLLLLNKIDRLDWAFDFNSYTPPLDTTPYAEVLPISGLKGYGLDALLNATINLLHEGPKYFDEDQLCDRDQRYLVAELVREKVFNLTGQEIPYGVFLEVEEFKEKEVGKYYIRIVIYVERDSQKGILIGKGGALLKRIGQLARPEIETLIGAPVYLDLWVKVRKNWRKSEAELRRLGFIKKKGSR
ncbi:MAG: GTPase Era [bacterium]